MTRMTKRLEDGKAAMDCIACAKQGVVCHLLSCRNRLKERVCDYEDVIQSNGLVKQERGRWIKRKEVFGEVYCSECQTIEKTTDSNFKTPYCPWCGAKMDGDTE